MFQPEDEKIDPPLESKKLSYKVTIEANGKKTLCNLITTNDFLDDEAICQWLLNQYLERRIPPIKLASIINEAFESNSLLYRKNEWNKVSEEFFSAAETRNEFKPKSKVIPYDNKKFDTYSQYLNVLLGFYKELEVYCKHPHLYQDESSKTPNHDLCIKHKATNLRDVQAMKEYLILAIEMEETFEEKGVALKKLCLESDVVKEYLEQLLRGEISISIKIIKLYADNQNASLYVWKNNSETPFLTMAPVGESLEEICDAWHLVEETVNHYQIAELERVLKKPKRISMLTGNIEKNISSSPARLIRFFDESARTSEELQDVENKLFFSRAIRLAKREAAENEIIDKETNDSDDSFSSSTTLQSM